MRCGRADRRLRFFVSATVAALAGVFFAVPVSNAAAQDWQASAGDWSNPANWGGTLPTSSSFVDQATINNGGTATVSLAGAQAAWLTVDSSSGINMTGGSLTVPFVESIGFEGTGSFTQSGGTNNVGELGVGWELVAYPGYGNGGGSFSPGVYTLSGTGSLVAGGENVVTGTFQQTGGSNAVGQLSIGAGAQYVLSGGTLSINDGFANNGTIDGRNQPATLAANALVDLSTGTLKNSLAWSVDVGSTGLLIVPAGFNPSTSFAKVTSSGLGVHVLGTPLAVPSGQGFVGSGQITDFVTCQGTIAAPSLEPPLNLTNGLNLSGSGSVNLGWGSLTTNGFTSRMSGGTLSAGCQFVGSGGTGEFVQTAGTNSLTNGGLNLGCKAADAGGYVLGGTGQLMAFYEYVGLSGTGAFAQSGGINTVGGDTALFLGYGSTGKGTYNLSGGTLSALVTQEASASEYIGYSGTGNFLQSGGTNAAVSLCLGYSFTGVGTYSLSAGTLSAQTEQVGCAGTGTVTQSGGSNTVSSLLLGSDANSGLNVVGGKGTYDQSGGTTAAACLALGCDPGSTAKYVLGGTGSLAAANEYVGYSSAATATFQQTGGSNSVTSLSIGPGDQYVLSGGTLSVSGSLLNSGTVDGGNGAATLVTNCLVDLTSGTWKDYSDWSVKVGSGGLAIVPPGFKTSTGFASFTNMGLGVHVLGTTLTVPAGQGFTGAGSIGDPVVCQGTITAAASAGINLDNGVALSGNGSVNLGSGNLTVNDAASGISGGTLSAANQFVGNGGTGVFTQSAGTNTVGDYISGLGQLYLGYNSGGTGTYNLSGTGVLSALSEYIGYSSTATATFRQTGGTNTVTGLSIGSGGQYVLSGGTLSVGGSLVNNGTVDGGNRPATLSAGCLVDLTSGTWKNYSEWSVNIASGGLLIVPPGFNASTGFASVTNSGMDVHVLGTTLTVPAGQGFAGAGPISDPVVCQGTIVAASGGGLNLNNGLVLSGYGNVTLGNGNLTVNDAVSGMSGGTLSTANQYVGSGGSGGSGVFSHSGGSNTFSTALYVGYNPTDTGTYNLSGTGTLSSSGAQSFPSTGTEYIGYSGTGTFAQSGGTNTVPSLYVGYNSTGRGAYNLSGGSLSDWPYLTVGYSGLGSFTQSGGTNSGLEFYLGYNSTGAGTYNLTGGSLSEEEEETIGVAGTGTFTQSGGTNFVDALFIGSNFLCSTSTGVGKYDLSGGTLSAPGAFIEIGCAGTGTFTQSAGTANVGLIYLGDCSTGKGTYNLNGGTLATAGISSGAGAATFNFGGGTLQATGPFTATLPMTLTGTGGSANVDTSYGDMTLSGALSGPGGFTKLGAGTLTLTAANSYQGLTTIQAGTLWLGADAQTPIFSLGGVDLQGGSLVLSYSGASPAAAVESALAAAHRHDFAAGSAQIFSSTAATDGLTLGWSDNGNGAVIIMATLPGDAFLDGAVDVNDLTVVLTHFGVTGAVWSQGDFTYDGRVDINDLTIVLANFGQSLGSPGAGLAAVPEPSALVLLALAIVLPFLLTRVRRRAG